MVSKRATAILAALIWIVMAAGAAWAQGGLAYDVRLEGLANSKAKDLFDEVSVLEDLKKTPPRSLAELRDRVRRDVKSLERILQSRGYYASRVSYRVERGGERIAIVLMVEEGVRYNWTTSSVRWADAAATAELEAIVTAAQPKLPRPLLNASIVNFEQAVLSRLPEIGYPQPRLIRRDVVVDHATATVALTLDIDPGPRAAFGEVRFEGLDSVKPAYLKRLVPWQTGDAYDARLVDRFRLDLAKTNLFSAVEVETRPDGSVVPLIARVREAKHRTYGAGGGYSTSDGFGGNAFWEHRNFFGQGERLRLLGAAAEIEQSLAASLDVPSFRRHDQRLLIGASLRREAPDAYTSYSAETSVVLERPFADHWTLLFGGALEYSRVTDLDGTRHFYLLGGRGGVRRDDTDSLLDPTRGSRFSISARPFIGEQSGALQFTIFEAAASAYLALDDRRYYVMAARLKAGTVIGADLGRLPATKRFYAGGGSSVRGYRYQFAGPLDANGDPIGGRSLIEAGLEARLRIAERLGIVPFIEAGQVDAQSLPDFKEKVFVGAGVGARYYTSFAPVRLDIAFPLTRRDVDHHFEIYISLGQSF